MSENYAKLYQSRKEQLTTQNKSVQDVKNDSSTPRSTRSNSASPSSRSNSANPAPRSENPVPSQVTQKKENCPRKVVYLQQMKELKSELISMLETNCKYLEGVLENKVNNLNNEKTQNELNDKIKSLTEQLEKHARALGDLQGSVAEIQDIL